MGEQGKGGEAAMWTMAALAACCLGLAVWERHDGSARMDAAERRIERNETRVKILWMRAGWPPMDGERPGGGKGED